MLLDLKMESKMILYVRQHIHLIFVKFFAQDNWITQSLNRKDWPLFALGSIIEQTLV
jgi:hypothetical protein